MKKILLILLIIIIAASPVSYASTTGPYLTGFIEGYISGWVGGRIQIEEYDGTVHTLSFVERPAFMIDQRPAGLKDFKVGMEVYAELTGRSISYMDSFSTENPGYIPPGSKVRSGNIQKIGRDQITVKLPTGGTETYFFSSATIVQKKGINVPLNTLYEGDRVRLFFDEADSVMVSRMQIEGDSVIIKDLYRGTLNSAGSFEAVITLGDVDKFENGKWKTVKSSMSIPYSDELPVYIGGQRIPYKNLKYYTGKAVYMAVKNFFGKDRIEKMILRSQYESAYSEKIEEINWFAGAFELSNRRNITFNEGTVIIKNGRLVDQYAINPMSDAFVVADGRGGELMADVIYIYNEDINNSNIGQNYIYAGRLDQIVQDKVVLKDFFLLNKNSWESFSDEKELFYDNDTGIIDLEAGRIISPEEFYSGDYAVDEDTGYARNNRLKDWYAYIYADGDRIAGIMVQKNMDSLLGQRTTNGIAESISVDPLVGWTINLRNGADWSGRKEKWVEKSVSTRINIETAMIIKDGEIVPQDELRPGDRLYIIRDGFEAKVVIVK